MAPILETRDRAKRLPRGAKDAEEKLWSQLRARSLGLKFRRQHRIGPFIADFCIERKLVVGLDGGQHAGQHEYDSRRTEYMKSRGYRVIRFCDHEMLRDIEAVLEQIGELCRTLPQSKSNMGEGPDGVAFGVSYSGRLRICDAPVSTMVGISGAPDQV